MQPMSPVIRIFHTLWTKPLKEERTPVTLLCYAISFYYAKQMGAEVVLHTDSLGAEMLSFLHGFPGGNGGKTISANF